MPSLKVSVPHNLSKKAALIRIRNIFSQLQKEHSSKISNVKEDWYKNKGEFHFTSYGYDIGGLIEINKDDVDIKANVPWRYQSLRKKSKK